MCLIRALGEAVKIREYEVVKFLLKKGANVMMFANDQDMILLELSVSRDNAWRTSSKESVELFQVLLEAGADINGPTPRNPTAHWNTALTTAVMDPNVDKQIHLALGAGADIHKVGGSKIARTPLQAAAESGRADIAKELLERAAYVNAPATP
jgi:ankyrin repeat protein